MTDAAARALAEEWAFALGLLPLIEDDDGLLDNAHEDVVALLADRLRPLLAERDALRAALQPCIHPMEMMYDMFKMLLRSRDKLLVLTALNGARAALSNHAAAGQPQSEGGEAPVAPGPAFKTTPSPAAALEPNPEEPDR